MSTQTASRAFSPKSRSGNASLVVRALAVPGALRGGMVLAPTMMIVMGTAHLGFASAINIGMPAFALTITPPLQMLSSLMLGMGINLPSSAMAQLAMAIDNGHLSSAMASQMGAMLSSMHMPMAKLQMMGMIMTGHATNAAVTSMMSSMTPSARAAVMSAMLLNVGHMAVGLVRHFAFSKFLGLTFFAILGAFELTTPQALRTRMMFVGTGVIGVAVVYLVIRFGLLPSTNPLMGFVPPNCLLHRAPVVRAGGRHGLCPACERRSLESAFPAR